MAQLCAKATVNFSFFKSINSDIFYIVPGFQEPESEGLRFRSDPVANWHEILERHLPSLSLSFTIFKMRRVKLGQQFIKPFFFPQNSFIK